MFTKAQLDNHARRFNAAFRTPIKHTIVARKPLEMPVVATVDTRNLAKFVSVITNENVHS